MCRTSSVIRVMVCFLVCSSFSEQITAQSHNAVEKVIPLPRRDLPSSPPPPSSSVPPSATQPAATVTWDVAKAVQHLQDNARSKPNGWCAKFVRRAIEAGAGGATMTRTFHAKDYGPSLVQNGFREFSSSAITPDKFKKGDVVVIQATKGHASGHMAMYDGKKWISDFKQRDHWGGSIRDAKPAYKVYRRVPASVSTPNPGGSATGTAAAKPSLGGVLINPMPRREDANIDQAEAEKVLRNRPGSKARTWRIKLPNRGDHRGADKD